MFLNLLKSKHKHWVPSGGTRSSFRFCRRPPGSRPVTRDCVFQAAASARHQSGGIGCPFPVPRLAPCDFVRSRFSKSRRHSPWGETLAPRPYWNNVASESRVWKRVFALSQNAGDGVTMNRGQQDAGVGLATGFLTISWRQRVGLTV